MRACVRARACACREHILRKSVARAGGLVETVAPKRPNVELEKNSTKNRRNVFAAVGSLRQVLKNCNIYQVNLNVV